MKIVAIMVVVILLSSISPGEAAEFDGRWAVKTGGRDLLVLELLQTGASCSGKFTKPSETTWPAPGALVKIKSSEIETAEIRSCEMSSGHLQIRASVPNGRQYRFEVAIADYDHLSFRFMDRPMPSMSMEKIAAAENIAANWDGSRSYAIDESRPDNPELKVLFSQDQADREKKDFDYAAPDTERRQRVAELLAANQLHTGSDFQEAAFIFQHGVSPDDYLLAHTLAIIAVKKGRLDATWIAAATLDRYLQHIEQPQIYGTQFLLTQGNPDWTQGNYDSSVISDSLREELGVPHLDSQKKQEATLNATKH